MTDDDSRLSLDTLYDAVEAARDAERLAEAVPDAVLGDAGDDEGGEA